MRRFPIFLSLSNSFLYSCPSLSKSSISLQLSVRTSDTFLNFLERFEWRLLVFVSQTLLIAVECVGATAVQIVCKKYDFYIVLLKLVHFQIEIYFESFNLKIDKNVDCSDLKKIN